MDATWKEKAKGFLTPKAITHEVGGHEHQFYPLSTRIIFRLRGLTGPLVGALSNLFETGDKDQGEVHREFQETEGDGGGRGLETQILPIDPELARMRASMRERSILQLVEAVTDTKNKIIVGLIICDSMRDVFDRCMADDDVCEFVDDKDLTVPVMVEMIIGVAKANKKVFGPLADKVSAMMGSAAETAMDNARKEVANLKEESENPEEPSRELKEDENSKE